MPAVQRSSNYAATVDELIVEVTIEALNAALAEHGVTPDRIITIHFLPGVYIANGTKPRYRILYLS